MRLVGRRRDLFHRREARLEQRHQRLRLLADDRTPRRAEVEQHRMIVGQQQDVGRRDLAVNVTRAVQHLERTEQAVEQRSQRGFVGRLVERLAQGEQRRAGVVRHRTVGGAVGFPAAQHMHERRVIAAREHLRFVDERMQPALEGLRMGRCAQREAHRVAVARGECDRQVFLDRDAAIELQVAREIDDAEAARADHPLELELFEPRAGWQCVVRGHRVGRQFARSGSAVRRRRAR